MVYYWAVPKSSTVISRNVDLADSLLSADVAWYNRDRLYDYRSVTFICENETL